jgi:hypothetical protein
MIPCPIHGCRQPGGSRPSRGRRVHRSVDGTEMIVWGGAVTAETSTNQGGRYNPSTDRWTATSTDVNAIGTFLAHRCFWTGTQMIVWGGRDTVTHGATPAACTNPATNTWAQTSTARTTPRPYRPHGRVDGDGDDRLGRLLRFYYCQARSRTPAGATPHRPTAGRRPRRGRMARPCGNLCGRVDGNGDIVWGGKLYSDTFYNTGGATSRRSTPGRSTSTGANVPSARAAPSAVWTGTEMIVWGGYYGGSASTRFNTGGRYNPSTDNWLATSTGANNPSARYLQTAVWTGTKMIVWGGYDGTPLNTGGRYDPGTDSWMAISTGANAPSARYFHAAVWTGARMVVWGGDLRYGPRQHRRALRPVHG